MASTCLDLSYLIPMYCAALRADHISIVSVDILISLTIFLNLQAYTTNNQVSLIIT